MAMNCVVCGQPTASKVIETRVGRYRAESVNVESEFFRCGTCREEFFSPAQAQAHVRAVKNEIRKKYGLLPPEKIAEIRNKLKLSQAELEELLGTGSKVIVRWESGKVIQGAGQDNMLRLLDRDPKVVDDLRQIQRFRCDEQKKYQLVEGEAQKRVVARAV